MGPSSPPTTIAELGARLADPYPPGPGEVGLDAAHVLAVPSQGQVLYRLVSDPLALRDFTARPKPKYPDTPFLLHLGLSMFETQRLAEARAQRYPAHVARVEPPRSGDHAGTDVVALAGALHSVGHPGCTAGPCVSGELESLRVMAFCPIG